MKNFIYKITKNSLDDICFLVIFVNLQYYTRNINYLKLSSLWFSS